MTSPRGGVLALCAALAALGCTRAAPATADPGEAVRSAALAVERSRGCADVLDRAAVVDPSGVARALAIPPATLAPVRAQIAERHERARADAVAASSLARAAEDEGAAAAASGRALRSLATSSELCRAADLVDRERLARSR